MEPNEIQVSTYHCIFQLSAQPGQDCSPQQGGPLLPLTAPRKVVRSELCCMISSATLRGPLVGSS